MHIGSLEQVPCCDSVEQHTHSGMAQILQLPCDSSSVELRGACLTEDQVLEFVEARLPERCLQRVVRHLDGCGACSRLLAETLGAMHGDTCTDPGAPTSVQSFSPGSVVARRFQISCLAGRGGMGEVYDAQDLKTGTRVALKTVAVSRCDLPDAVERLCLEARLNRKIRHPNVSRVLSVGVQHMASSGERLYYLTMPFVEGQTLGRRIRERGRLPMAEAVALARDVLLGLRAAHAAGVVHLDVKTDNVMLESNVPGARAIIIDFGLARRLKQDGTVTGSHSLSGTISYMAPEQLLGLPRGPFTDIFAFGVVLYEALTGEHPLSTRHASMRSAMARVARLPLQLSRSMPEVPVPLAQLVARCTQSQPEDRYLDASCALDGLSACGVG
jgi:serine/threonine protein kinase